MLRTAHDKIIIPILNGLDFIADENIISVHSEGNYTNFILKGKPALQSAHTLKFFEQQLLAHGFLRVHESSIINPVYIKSYKKGDGGIVILENNREIAVARDRKNEFLLALAVFCGSAEVFARIVNHLR